MTILYAEFDLAKNVFALHGVAARGAVVLRQPKVALARLHKLVAARQHALEIPYQQRDAERCALPSQRP